MKIENETKHTPTPWEIDPTAPGYVRKAGTQEIILRVNGFSYSDAEFIVRAVNSHEKLLSYAKDLRDTVENNLDIFGHEILDGIKKSIADAEGK